MEQNITFYFNKNMLSALFIRRERTFKRCMMCTRKHLAARNYATVMRCNLFKFLTVYQKNSIHLITKLNNILQ